MDTQERQTARKENEPAHPSATCEQEHTQMKPKREKRDKVRRVGRLWGKRRRVTESRRTVVI